MTISIIVAVADNGVIGNRGELAWHLPGEMAHFKAVTMGHPIIMGRKTHESIGRALPGRTNIVISRNQDYEAPGCIVVGSIEAALNRAGDEDEVFIIGGATIYDAALPITNQLYLTKVHATPEGDTFFRYDSDEWTVAEQEEHAADEKNQYAYTFMRLTRKD